MSESYYFLFNNKNMSYNHGQKYLHKRQILWESIRKGLTLDLKAEKQLQNKNHTKDRALGSHPCDN